MSSAWVTKEWTDEGRRRREQVAAGNRGVKESDRFVVEWIDPAGKRCREKISESGRVGKRQADERCRQLNSQLSLGRYEEKNCHSWADVKAQYLRDIVPTKRSERSQREIRETLDRFERIIRPIKMQAVTTATIDRFVAERRQQKTRDDKEIRNTTVNKDLRNLKAFFRRVYKWKAIPEVPEIEMLDEVETERPIYTELEFAAMYAACDAATFPKSEYLGTCPRRLWWQTLLSMFWETGTRRGETLSIDWPEIDMDRRLIRVDPAKTKSKRLKEFSFGELTAQNLRLMMEHRLEDSPRVFVFPHDLARLNESLGEIQAKAQWKDAKGVVQRIDAARAHLKFHAFRRTVGEFTAERYGLIATQHKLGHSNPAITGKHYAKAAMRKGAQSVEMPIPAGILASERN